MVCILSDLMTNYCMTGCQLIIACQILKLIFASTTGSLYKRQRGKSTVIIFIITSKTTRHIARVGYWRDAQSPPHPTPVLRSTPVQCSSHPPLPSPLSPHPTPSPITHHQPPGDRLQACSSTQAKTGCVRVGA